MDFSGPNFFQSTKGDKTNNQSDLSKPVNLFGLTGSQNADNSSLAKKCNFNEISNRPSQSTSLFGDIATTVQKDHPISKSGMMPTESTFGISTGSPLTSSAFQGLESNKNTVFGGQLSLNAFKAHESKPPPIFGEQAASNLIGSESKLDFGGPSNAFMQQESHPQQLFGEQSHSLPFKDQELREQPAIFGGHLSVDAFGEKVQKPPTSFRGQPFSKTINEDASTEMSTFQKAKFSERSHTDQILPTLSTSAFAGQDPNPKTIFGGTMHSPTFPNPLLQTTFRPNSQASSLSLDVGREPASYKDEDPNLGQFSNKNTNESAYGGQHSLSNVLKTQDIPLPNLFGGELSANIVKEQGQNEQATFGRQKVSNILKEQVSEVQHIFGGNPSDSVSEPKPLMKFGSKESSTSMFGKLPSRGESDNIVTMPVTEDVFRANKNYQLSGNVDKAMISSHEANAQTMVADKLSTTGSEFIDTFNKGVYSPPISAGDFNIKSSTLFSNADNASENVTNSVNAIDEILAVKNQVVSPVKKKPTTLIAIDVPAKYLNKDILRMHFEKFGQINRLLINMKSKQALIYFTNHISALNAKNNGRKLHPNLPEMKLLFRASPQGGTKDLSSTIGLPIESKVVSSLARRKATQSEDQPKSKRSRQPSPLSTSVKISAAGEMSIPSSFAHDPLATKANTSLSLERYSLLDARDKLIRNKQDKVYDVRKAQYLAASCPDMCPEKERYIRHVQNDLSSFELTDGQLDHRLAVKQFSRSSADKEEPLPYELRPGPVLRKTMDFLLCNIVEKIDKDMPEVWYNYMWNRTRALRNDLMQQHLVDQNAIHVLERCIRFHIHCQHEFCENATDMDPKMNDEHLSKSLQSLREAYHDLGEVNEFSVSEPEFRSYDILLNLGHEDFSFRYRKFSDSVRQSPPVKFAIKVSYAFHSSNYIKFFKLVRSGSYLQGCILHKYYKVLRKKALQTIVKAYTLNNITQSLHKDHMKMMLGMSDDSEIEEFLDNYNLPLSTIDNTVKINRTKIITAEAYVLRQDKCILAKRKCTVAEVINGGILPPNPLLTYHPHNSFTEAGTLTEKARNASDQSTPRKQHVYKSPAKVVDELEKRLLHRVTVNYEMNLLRKCFQKWLHYAKTERTVGRARQARLQRKYFNKWHTAVCRTIRANVLADNFYLGIYFKKWRVRVEQSKLVQQYRQQVRDNLKRNLAVKYVRNWKMGVIRLKQKRRLAAIREQFLSRKYVMAWQSIVITSRVMKDANNYYERNLLSKTFCSWRTWIMARQLEREQLNRDYPAIASSMDVEQQNEQWNWGYDRANSQNLSALDVSNLGTIINRSLEKSGVTNIDTFFECFPFADKFRAHINSHLYAPKQFNQFLKLYVYISTDLSESMVAWIRAKFNLSREKNTSGINESLTLYSQRAKCPFIIVIVESKELFVDQMFSTVIAFCSIRDIQRVKQLIEAKTPTNMLLVCESSRTDMHSPVWQLSVGTMNSPNVSDRFVHKIFDIWQCLLDNSTIRVAQCNSVFNEAFTRIILHPVQKIVNQRSSFGCYKMSPSIVLNMYNEFVNHFASCVKQNGSNDLIPVEILNHADFSAIRQENYGNTIKTLIDLKLPHLNVKEGTSWSTILEEIYCYCNAAFCDDWNDDIKSEIFYILQSAKENISGGSDIVDVLSIPWIDIIFRLISHKMTSLDNSVIIYDSQLLANFLPTEDYLSYLKIYTAPCVQKSPIEDNSEGICCTKKRKPEDDAVRSCLTKKNKSSLLQNLADETLKMKELELKLKNEIDLGNIDLALFNQT